MVLAAGSGLRLDANWVDYLLIALYFVFVLGIGWSPGGRSPPGSTSSCPVVRCRPG